MSKIKIAIEDQDGSTKLLGIDLSKISAFIYSGVSIQLWFDGASEALYLEKSQVQTQAFSQLLGALEDEFPELYGDETSETERVFAGNEYDGCFDDEDDEDLKPRESQAEYDPLP